MDSDAKLKVGVLMGGPSSEYEVSLKTGQKVIENLSKDKYEVSPIHITKQGEWLLNGKPLGVEAMLSDINIAFIAMHGEFGEDGQIQTILEQHGKPYTGSGKFASQLAIDKYQSKVVFKNKGLLTPRASLIRYGEKGFLQKFESISSNGPWFVKPVCRGSSVGASLVDDKKAIFDAIQKSFLYDNQALVEEYITGREFTCGILENYNDKKYFALPVTEIIPTSKHAFFDYGAKYTKDAAKEITPAEISTELSNAIQAKAVAAHTALNCRGYSRSDFIVTPKNEIYILELNTLPGMTETSLLPQAAKAAGIEFPELLDKIIHNGMKNYYA